MRKILINLANLQFGLTLADDTFNLINTTGAIKLVDQEVPLVWINNTTSKFDGLSNPS